MYYMDPEDAERHRQAHRAAAHDINSLLNTLGENDLRVLGMVLDTIAVAENPSQIAAFHSGRITSLMESRFKICGACGENHDAQLNDLVKEEKPEAQVWATTQLGSILSVTADEQALMDEYNLDDLRDGDTNALLGFICKNCSAEYQSIKERMAREPGPTGCAGCIHKTRWG